MLLIVNLQLSEFLQFSNLDIWRMESQPKLATSYSQKNSNKQKSRIFATCPEFWKSRTTEVQSICFNDPKVVCIITNFLKSKRKILSLSLANQIIQTIVTRVELKRQIYKETNQWCNIISKSLLMTFKITLERLWFH